MRQPILLLLPTLVAIAVVFARPAAADFAADKTACVSGTDHDAAIAACTRQLSSGKWKGHDLAIMYRNRGLHYQSKADPDNAIADFSQAIKIDQNYSEAWVSRGFAHWQKKDDEHAVQDFDAALRINPKDEYALLYRGEIAAGKLEYDRAISDFSEVIRINPNSFDAFAKRASAYFGKGDMDHYQLDQDQALRIDPKNINELFNRGSYLIAEKKDCDRGIADFSTVIALNRPSSNLAAAYAWRSRGRNCKNDLDQALADSEMAIRVAPTNFFAFTSRADVYVKKGLLDLAVADYDKVIQLNPKSAASYYGRGDIFFEKGDYERAIADYSQGISQNLITSGAGYLKRGKAYIKTGEAARAIQDFGMALKTPFCRMESRASDESCKEVPNAEVYLNRGSAYDLSGDRERARSDYMAAVRTAQEKKGSDEIMRQAQVLLAKLANNGVPTPAPQPVRPGAVPATAAAGRRVALIVGNSDYRSVPVLPNPQRDASKIASALRSVGFEKVTLLDDLDRDRLIDALRSFAREAETADWALVYFAGHGIEINGANYLIPVDAKLETDRDVGFEAVPLAQVMDSVEGAKKLRIVILDACRDNPFTTRMRRASANRSIGRGLARVEPDVGTLIVYSAKDGEVALDDDGSANSPFAAALVKEIATPGVEIRQLFDLVRDDVIDATHKRQQPFTYGSVPGRERFFFVPQQ